MSYQVGSALCSNSDEALSEIIGNWLYAGGINNTSEVAEMSANDVLAEMREMGCVFEAALMPPQYDEDGERVYEYLRPSDSKLKSIIEAAIEDAKGC